jgi:pilus assembly protein CpaB
VRPQTIIVVACAVVFGGSAAVGVRQFVGRGATPPPETVSVVVATKTIPSGTFISSDLIKTRDYPKELAPSGAIQKAEDAQDRSAYATIVVGEPLIESKLSPKGQRGLASLVASGMRAFTITTNVASGVAGFILPGNKVDVLLTLSSAGGSQDATGGGSSTTLLQNVEILAVDEKVEAPAENRVDSTNLRSVTLLVTPNQAAKLSLGQSTGKLHLTLRNPKDELAANVRPTTVNDIQFLSEPPTKPWDERAKDLIKAWAEAQAKRPPPAPGQPQVTPKKTIRTIRGSSEGMVVLTPVEAPG